MNAFSKIAHAKEHLGYKSGNIYSHTIDKDNAKNFVNGYQKILNFYKFHLPAQNKCIDLGCGAGHLTNEFKNHGFDITGLEYSNDALDVAKKHNPHLNIVQGDMSKFNEPNSYDFIFSREVYIITRVNAFTDQKNIISNIVHSLKPRGGVFMLVGSDVSYPDCMNYDLIRKVIKNQGDILVSQKYYEFIFRKFNKFIFGKISYKILEILLYPLIAYKSRKGWAKIYIILFKKK